MSKQEITDFIKLLAKCSDLTLTREERQTFRKLLEIELVRLEKRIPIG